MYTLFELFNVSKIILQKIGIDQLNSASHVMSVNHIIAPEVMIKNPPIDLLPDDILVEIFKHGFQHREIDNYNQNTPFEIVASHVSRRWRGVAVSTAALWSNVYIMHFQNLKSVETYLGRSQGHLLDIRFAIDQSLPHLMTETSTLALSLALLVSHVKRWRLFTVSSCSYPTLKKIVTAIEGLSAPNLTHFAVYLRGNECQNYSSPSDYSLEGSIFKGGLPRLSYFECRSVSIGSCWPSLPLGALTDLLLEVEDVLGGTESGLPLTRDRFHELLSSVPALVNLKLRGCIFQPETNPELSPVELPHLLSLDVDFNRNGDYTRNVLTTISSPALTSLTLFAIPPRVVDAFVGTVQKSKLPKYPVLTHLRFIGSYYPNLPGSIILSQDFFDVLPTITHFSILSCGQNTLSILNDLVALHANAREDIPWPKLRTIMIRTFGVRWLSPLCDLTAKRISRGHPLESVELCKLDSEKLSSGLEFLKQNVRLDLI